MKGLIDNASSQEHQIALLWQAIEKLSARCGPDECFEAEKLTQLVGSGK
jgi:serine O-acetyltransferase